MDERYEKEINLDLARNLQRRGSARKPVPLTAYQKKRAAIAARRKQIRRQRIFLLSCVLLLLLGVIFFIIFHKNVGTDHQNLPLVQKVNAVPATDDTLVQGLPLSVYIKHPTWEEDFLTPNEYSRPGDPLTQVKSIFVHYTANPGTSAAQNRSYFEQLKDTHITSASAHFIIGYDGEIIQCLPLDEIGYAVITRNIDSVSIECCYTAKDGSFSSETYDSLITLLTWLIDSYDLTVDDILRHYDCGGKACPLYYVDHEDAWNALKADVAAALASKH
jgi:hypothetical protein